MVDGREELRALVRDEPVPTDGTLLVRGGPNSVVKLAAHAERTGRAYTLDGSTLLGISVFLALDESGPASIELLLALRLQTYRVVHTASVSGLRDAEFGLLATFRRPHYTLILPDVGAQTLSTLSAALGPGQANPYHVARRRG